MAVVTGYFLTVSKERGYPEADKESLRKCLSNLGAEASTKLTESLRSTAYGVDGKEDARRIMDVIECSRQWVRDAVEAKGLRWEAGKVCDWVIKDPTWKEQLSGKGDGSTTQGKLQEMLGTTPEKMGSDDGKDAQHGKAVAKEGRAARKPEVKKSSERGDARTKGETWNKEERPYGHHVFGAKAAMRFELDVVKSHEKVGRGHTVRIEAAGRNARDKDVRTAWEDDQEVGRQKRYAWTKKTIFQLTTRELHQAAAVMLGLASGCVFRRGLEGKDKDFELRAQQGGVVAKMRSGRDAVAVPVQADDLYHVALVFNAALQKNNPQMDQRVILDVLRMTSRVAQKD